MPTRARSTDSAENVRAQPEAASAGDGPGAEGGFDVLYRRLRALCGRRLASERIDHTLQATALANEVWLKLYELDPKSACEAGPAARWFIVHAAVAIRQVLVDHARRRSRLKRGGGRSRLGLESAVDKEPRSDGLDEALGRVLLANDLLERLAVTAPLQSEIVVLRFFGGLGYAQIGEALGMSESAVRREWAFARVWLGRQPDLQAWLQ